MKIGLFGYEGNELREAAVVGLERLGHEVDGQTPSCWRVTQADDSFDGIVTCGLRSACGDAARYYAGKGKDVAIIDWPHLRIEGQYRVTPPDLFYLPEGDLPHDRLEALGVKLGTRKRVKAQGVLILGQSHGDPTHGAMSRSEFQAWAEGAAEKVHSLCDSKVTWRPHPIDRYEINEIDEYSDPTQEDLAEAMQRAWLVVVYSSTGGLEALISGLPVIADGNPVYKPLCGSFEAFKSLKAPTTKDLESLLARVAYTQWDAEEIATGKPFEPFFGDLLGVTAQDQEPDDTTDAPGPGPGDDEAIEAEDSAEPVTTDDPEGDDHGAASSGDRKRGS